MSLNINTDYPCNESNYTEVSNRTISYIVLHYVGATGSAKANAKYFAEHSNLGASAHYFVGHESEEGSIYQSVDPKNRAWHCGSETGTYKHDYCRNSNAIGIEMCCHKDASGNWYIDDATVDSAVELTKYLMEEYDIDVDNLLRHYDVTGKSCPAPWVADSSLWDDFKSRFTEDREEEDEDMIRYEKLDDIPNEYGFRDIIETLMDAKIINGDGSDKTGNNDVIDLSHDQVRSLIFEYRGGAFDRKLIAEGLDPVVED